MSLKTALTHCMKAVSRPQHMEGKSSGLTKLRTQTGVWQDKEAKIWGAEYLGNRAVLRALEFCIGVFMSLLSECLSTLA